jgi:hypothetical protein
MNRPGVGWSGPLCAALLLVGCLGDIPMHDSGVRITSDLGPTDLVHPNKDYPNGMIRALGPYITIRPGQSVTLGSHVSCPAKASPCTLRWDLGDGRSSTKPAPGKVTYSKEGFYTVTLTVTDKQGNKDPTPSKVRVAVWSGVFKDSFNRATLLPDKHGWRRPLFVSDEGEMYAIQNNWLRITGSWGLPGSTAIIAWPTMRNCRFEAIKRRQAATAEHYSDIILRMHPTSGISQFYRVRIWEEWDPKTGDSGVELAIFKIGDATDEHGILLSDPTQPPSKRPTVCQQCAYLAAYPRTKNLRLVVELWEQQIHARLEDPAKPGVALLTTTATDTLDEPYLYAGGFGLTHFEGESLFDDVVVTELTKKPTIPDAGVAPVDAGPGGG